MKKFKDKIMVKKGFTLIELLLVIAIIGILAGVVLVSSGSSIEKSKRAAAITTMSSILPELVTCQDDNGKAINSAAPTATTPTSSNTYICCTDVSCTGNAATAGHNVRWPDINTKSGWAYGTPTGTLALGTYQFTATKTIDGTVNTITCSYADNGCN